MGIRRPWTPLADLFGSCASCAQPCLLTPIPSRVLLKASTNPTPPVNCPSASLLCLLGAPIAPRPTLASSYPHSYPAGPGGARLASPGPALALSSPEPFSSPFPPLLCSLLGPGALLASSAAPWCDGTPRCFQPAACHTLGSDSWLAQHRPCTQDPSVDSAPSPRISKVADEVSCREHLEGACKSALGTHYELMTSVALLQMRLLVRPLRACPANVSAAVSTSHCAVTVNEHEQDKLRHWAAASCTPATTMARQHTRKKCVNPSIPDTRQCSPIACHVPPSAGVRSHCRPHRGQRGAHSDGAPRLSFQHRWEQGRDACASERPRTASRVDQRTPGAFLHQHNQPHQQRTRSMRCNTLDIQRMTRACVAESPTRGLLKEAHAGHLPRRIAQASILLETFDRETRGALTGARGVTLQTRCYESVPMRLRCMLLHAISPTSVVLFPSTPWMKAPNRAVPRCPTSYICCVFHLLPPLADGSTEVLLFGDLNFRLDPRAVPAPPADAPPVRTRSHPPLPPAATRTHSCHSLRHTSRLRSRLVAWRLPHRPRTGVGRRSS